MIPRVSHFTNFNGRLKKKMSLYLLFFYNFIYDRIHKKNLFLIILPILHGLDNFDL
jgi:hypothetical protein